MNFRPATPPPFRPFSPRPRVLPSRPLRCGNTGGRRSLTHRRQQRNPQRHRKPLRLNRKMNRSTLRIPLRVSSRAFSLLGQVGINPYQGEGFRDVGGVAAQGSGDVGVATPAHQGAGQVAKSCHHLESVAGPYLGAILVKGYVPYPMHPVLDVPMLPENPQQPLCPSSSRLDPCRFNPTSLNNCGTTSTQTFFGYRYRLVSCQTSPGRWPPHLTSTSGA